MAVPLTRNTPSVTEIPTDVIVITPTSRPGATPSVVVITLSVTEIPTDVIVITPTSRPGATPSVVVITLSAGQPSLTSLYTPRPECASRWLLINSTITSGYNPATALAGGIDANYWRTCYPGSRGTPVYSPGMCFVGHTMMNSLQALLQRNSDRKPETQWQALCCPTYVQIPTRWPHKRYYITAQH
jgi:hypothetical protein